MRRTPVTLPQFGVRFDAQRGKYKERCAIYIAIRQYSGPTTSQLLDILESKKDEVNGEEKMRISMLCPLDTAFAPSDTHPNVRSIKSG